MTDLYQIIRSPLASSATGSDLRSLYGHYGETEVLSGLDCGDNHSSRAGVPDSHAP